jgi:hypothetical protein
MDQHQHRSSQPSPLTPRRRLLQRPVVRASPKPEMAKVYNEAYRERLIASGIPDRRLLAEAIMQAVLAQLRTKSPEAAASILRDAKRLLKSLVDGENRPVYNDEGIHTRIVRIASELQSGGAGRRTRTDDPRT